MFCEFKPSINKHEKSASKDFLGSEAYIAALKEHPTQRFVFGCKYLSNDLIENPLTLFR
jgi:hypothetical protein